VAQQIKVGLARSCSTNSFSLCCVVHYKTISVAQSVLVWFGHWLVGWLPSLWVQSTLPGLDHVEEVGDGLLLHDGQGVEVATEGVRQLRFVQTGSTCHLEVVFVSSQRVHLKLEKVNHVALPSLPQRNPRAARSSTTCALLLLLLLLLCAVFALSPFPLCPHRLNDIFVVLADVNVLGSCVHRQPQLLLGDCPLDPLAVRGVTGRFGAALPVLQEATVWLTFWPVLCICLVFGSTLANAWFPLAPASLASRPV